MASPRRLPPALPPDIPAPLPPPPAPTDASITIAIKTKLTSPPNSVREHAQRIETLQKQRSSSTEKDKSEEQNFVRNSSFLSRDVETQKVKEIAAKIGKESPPKTNSPKKVVSDTKKDVSPPKNTSPPKSTSASPPKSTSPPKNVSPPKEVLSPPPTATSSFKVKRADSSADENSVAARANKFEAACSPPSVTSPPSHSASAGSKMNRTNSKDGSGPPKVPKRENSLIKDKDAPPKTETPVVVVKNEPEESGKQENKTNLIEVNPKAENIGDKNPKSEESNGVGDKIKKFEKAAEESAGKLSRPGSVRGRTRTDRLGSDSKDDFPPPATPFKDNVHFELPPQEKETHTERPQQGIMKNNPPPKWQRSESHEDKVIQKPEPQKIIKPEFKPMPSPGDVTIRSPSLGAKLPDQFPSHGTAFRNVASPDQARNVHKFNDDVNTQNNVKACNKFKPKEAKSFVSKGSSYFTRGSEEIWLVKKKDIEEIEERVLDSFRRAGGNVCMRSESMRPSSDSGQGVSFSHATMGRNKRQMYARSESCDPQWAGARSQTLKRQTSVACTCGHDKKTRAKSAGPEPASTPRPRSRSHGDDKQGHVLDKYETLV